MNRRSFLRRAASLLAGMAVAPAVAEDVLEALEEYPEGELPNVVSDPWIAELMDATLKDLGQMRFADIAADLQNHAALRNLLRKDRISFNVSPEVKGQ